MSAALRSDAVGKRVHVFWHDEGEWFAGCVQDVDGAEGYFVVYDDGDERWEAPTQLVRFEGDTAGDDDAGGDRVASDEEQEYGDDDEEEEGVMAQPRSSRAPQMLEPPASPSDAYDDDDEDEEENANGGGSGGTVHDNNGHDARVGGDENDGEEEADAKNAYVHGLEDSDGDEDLDERRNQHGGSDSDDGEQSIAMSEVPITFERLRGRVEPSIGARSTESGVRLPARGVLRGKVLFASHLPSLSSSYTRSGGKLALVPPRAFVKIAFVEAGDNASTSASNLMLRCKNALSSTSVAMPSCSPVWNELSGNGHEVDGEFQMQLAPPQAKFSSSTSVKPPPPAWLQLRGDVLFSVYSASGDADNNDVSDGRSRRQVHDFIGQAVLSLPDILREALFVSPTLVRRLPLHSRQGKSLAPSRSNGAMDSEDEGDAMTSTPELVISLEFEPTYSEEVRQRVKAFTPPSTTVLKRSTSARSQPKTSSQQPKQQQKAPSSQQAKRTHTSSSAVNRKKFEKQVDQQNVAFAKRIEWQYERRARLTEHAKAQAKSKYPVPQHGTMKRDHKASSSVNRGKFQQQIRGENRAMAKRLHAIALKNNGDSKLRRADAKGCDVGFDDLDKDKLLACDRREQKLREQDFLMERAQAKYHKQNAVVEEVMALQTDIAELHAQVFAAKASVNRLDILTNKDRHLCKCLRSAVETAATVSSGSSARGGSAQVLKRRSQREKAAVEDDADNSDADVVRQRKELELLKKEAASLDADKQSRSQELRACNQREQELDDEIHRLSAQLRFVQDKQAFQLRMNSKAGAAEQRLVQDMKKKQQLLELSRDEEEQWKLHQAQQELTQLQIAVQVLKERRESPSQLASSSSTSTAACEYLQRKIERQKQKLEQLETEQRHFQHEYEVLMVSGEQDALRRQVHELQQTLFLCQAQHKQIAAAQRHAKFADEKLAMELRKQAFEQQTETDMLFKQRR